VAPNTKPARNTKAIPDLALPAAINIPLNQLRLSDANVRSIGANDREAIAGLADSIARHGLLQSLMVRPLLDDDGEPSGLYEVPGGGRRLRALQLLAKQKRIAADAPVPCIAKSNGHAQSDSLAENSDREELHPLDQFRAFAALREKGVGEAEIAATFRVTPAVVRQRLRLAAASPVLLEAYGADEINLDQLMAYCLTEDHARQELVFKALKTSGNHADWMVRRMLTEETVETTDRRARFVGLDAYVAAGGSVMQDLFAENGRDAYLQNPTLLTRLVDEKLAVLRDDLIARGWKWVEAAVQVPYEIRQKLRRLSPVNDPALDDRLETLIEELDDLNEAHEGDAIPKRVEKRIAALEAEIEAIENAPEVFAEEDMAIAGAFVTIDHHGKPCIEAGFVRKEDDPENCTAKAAADGHEGTPRKGLSDSLMQDLTSYRTVALRDALASDFGVAFLAVLHAMCLGIFYHRSHDAALQVKLDENFPASAPGLGEWPPARAIDERHTAWAARLPRSRHGLWQALVDLSDADRAMLFAHCASRAINAVRQKHLPHDDAIRNAHEIAHALGFDMVRAGWQPTVDTYLGRVPKALILEAVAEGRDQASADIISHLKKAEMAREAERLLAGSGWLPDPLRLPDLSAVVADAKVAAAEDADADDSDGDGEGDLPDFLNRDEGEGAAADT